MSDTLHAKVTGDASLPPLLLVHGFPLNHTMWQAQIEPLSKLCRVIAPDLPGFGQSKLDMTEANRGLDMADYATALGELLDEMKMDQPVILCGFSMGGYILWQFARRYPERVQALVVCDTRADDDSAETIAARQSMAAGIFQSGVEPVVEAMMPKLLAKQTFDSRPEIAEQVAEIIRSTSPEAIAAAQRGMARRPDMQSALASFDWPALVVAGAEDAISPPDVLQAIANSLPQGKFVEIAGAGHMSPLESPDAFNEAVTDFVRSL